MIYTRGAKMRNVTLFNGKPVNIEYTTTWLARLEQQPAVLKIAVSLWSTDQQNVVYICNEIYLYL